MADPMTRMCRCGLPSDPPSGPHWVPSRDPEPGGHVLAVAICDRDPAFLRHERVAGGWRSNGAAAIHPAQSPPRPWRRVGYCWDATEHPVRDVTGLLHRA